MLMLLSQKTGTTLLDVEEVHDVYRKHVPAGTLGSHDPIFGIIFKDIWKNATKMEIDHAFLVMKRVWKHRVKKNGEYWEMQTRTPKEFEFEDFFVGLERWLKMQTEDSKMRRCTLTRFKFTYVERFKQRLDEATDWKRMADLCNEASTAVSSRGGALMEQDNLAAEHILDVSIDLAADLHP